MLPYARIAALSVPNVAAVAVPRAPPVSYASGDSERWFAVAAKAALLDAAAVLKDSVSRRVAPEALSAPLPAFGSHLVSLCRHAADALCYAVVASPNVVVIAAVAGSDCAEVFHKAVMEVLAGTAAADPVQQQQLLQSRSADAGSQGRGVKEALVERQAMQRKRRQPGL